MKPQFPNPNRPDPLEDALRPRIRRTSAALEARFAALKADLPDQLPAQPARRLRFTAPARALWIGTGAIAATLALGTLLFLSVPEQRAPGGDAVAAEGGSSMPYFLTEDPFALEESLEPALVLLDQDTLLALLHLPNE
jgi:hypothetical protein